MDSRGVLDRLLHSGKQVLSESCQAMEGAVGVPDSGLQRKAVLSGLAKGVVAGGILGLMLGTRGGRRVAGKVIKYGSLAAAATVAYKAYQEWESHFPDQASGMSINDLDDHCAEERSLLLIRAMIAAAESDGHVDEREQRLIQTQLDKMDLDEETIAMLQTEFAEPISLEQLANEIDSTAAAAEVYLLSSLVIDDSVEAGRDYLSELASILKLPMELVDRLDEQSKQS
ncbi:MAG: tellurite resistance TerB family protein [Rubripirellula sp.]